MDKKVIYIYIIESLQRRRFFPLQQKLDLKDIISEISQMEKEKFCKVSLICGI